MVHLIWGSHGDTGNSQILILLNMQKMHNTGTHPVLGVWLKEVMRHFMGYSPTLTHCASVRISSCLLNVLSRAPDMRSDKLHMARNSKNVFFRPLRQINLEINKCHAEAFPSLWSKNSGVFFMAELKPTGLFFPSSIHHHTQLSRKGTAPGKSPEFPLSLFPSLTPRACRYGVSFTQRVLSWESPLLKLRFWSVAGMTKNGRAGHL